MSKRDQAAVKRDFWAIFDLPADVVPGDAAVDAVKQRVQAFAATWQRRYPGAVDCVRDDFALLTAHLHFPRGHWLRIRHSNLIERTFGETRRRVKVMGRLSGERTCRSLVWAVLDRATAAWRGIPYTNADTLLLAAIRTELGITPPAAEQAQTMAAGTAAA